MTCIVGAHIVVVNSKGGPVSRMIRYGMSRRSPIAPIAATSAVLGLPFEIRVKDRTHLLWSDPLSFIGRAANEGQS